MKPRRFIRVFCVHRIPSSALKFFLGLQCHESGDAGRDCRRSQPARASTVARPTGQNLSDVALSLEDRLSVELQKLAMRPEF
jgi:hypothetical protein